MTRQEHLDWAKQRALAYVDQGELRNAFYSMASDLDKHSELKDHIGLRVGFIELTAGTDADRMRRWIEGFN